MKYTKKQIYKAFLKWETERRLNPSDFKTNEEINESNANIVAEDLTNGLIKYINK